MNDKGEWETHTEEGFCRKNKQNLITIGRGAQIRRFRMILRDEFWVTGIIVMTIAEVGLLKSRSNFMECTEVFILTLEVLHIV